MAASNTRLNSLGQSKTPIDSDHGIYRYCEGGSKMNPPRRILASGRGTAAVGAPARPVRIIVGALWGKPLL
jgi:hypothetical protein